MKRGRLDESFSRSSLHKSLTGESAFELDYSKIKLDKYGEVILEPGYMIDKRLSWTTLLKMFFMFWKY